MAKRDHLVREIIKYIELNWKQGVTVKEVAIKFSVDPSDADRLYRSVTGRVIGRYVQEKRKEYVIFMVRTTECHAYELAREFGYGEEHSFTRWIKNAFGMSWRELCRLHRDGSLPPRPHGIFPSQSKKSPTRRPPRTDTQK